MQTTKAKVWEAAKSEGVDRFISMIAKHFPGAIDVVHIKSPRCDVWCKAKQTLYMIPPKGYHHFHEVQK